MHYVDFQKIMVNSHSGKYICCGCCHNPNKSDLLLGGVAELNHHRVVVGEAVIALFVAEVAVRLDLGRGGGVVDVEDLVNHLAVIVAIAVAVRTAVIVGIGGRVGHNRLAWIFRIFTSPWIFNPRIRDSQAVNGVDRVDEEFLDLVAGVAEVGVAHQDRRATVAVRDDVVCDLTELGVLGVDMAAAGRAVGVHMGYVNIDLGAVLKGDEVVAEALGYAGVGTCRQSTVGAAELDAGLVRGLHLISAAPGEVDAVGASRGVITP